ncbi:MAG: hypothetical protein JXR37_09995 [Kiritimatiellae bacterium]|nr:hypothetical protein [Kiritimatiellia bacterium]
MESRTKAKVCSCLIAAVAVAGAGVPAPARGGPLTEKTANTPIPAFPGAEGHGALAVGGRGGEVVYVTNLNDAGPGSFRAAMLTPRPRLVVFRVAGTIFLKSFVNLDSAQSCVTVAGQTAPGLGVCLAGYPIRVRDGFHDGVFRYLRTRIGTNGHWRATRPADEVWYNVGPFDKSKIPAEVLDDWASLDAFAIIGKTNYVSDVIVDHCSLSWSIDETVSTAHYVKNVTFQWNIMAEASTIGHVEPGHNYGPILGSGNDYGRSRPLSFHHNYLAHHWYRAPQVCHLDIHYINNVNYNNGWDDFTIGSSQKEARPEADIIGNTFKQGPNHYAERYWGVKFHYQGANAYIADNRVLDIRGAPVPTYNPAEPWSVVKKGTGNPLYAYRRSNPLPRPRIPVTVHTAEEARELVLAGAGATRPARDSVDARIVADFRKGTGAFGIQSDYPDLCPNGACEPYPDEDRDGMDDRWERRHGLDPGDPADGPRDADRDGYTNVEEFLNETDPGRRE